MAGPPTIAAVAHATWLRAGVGVLVLWGVVVVLFVLYAASCPNEAVLRSRCSGRALAVLPSHALDRCSASQQVASGRRVIVVGEIERNAGGIWPRPGIVGLEP
jgi:hypothetical protein